MPFGSGEGTRLVKIVCVSFWTILCCLVFPFLPGLVATIIIRPDRIERRTIFGAKIIRWNKLELLRRLDKSDSRFELKGDETRFDINWTGYMNAKRLNQLLLEKLMEPKLGKEYRWRILFQPLIGFFISVYVFLCFACGGGVVYWYFKLGQESIMLGGGIFLILGGFALIIMSAGLNVVTERSIRCDPILGWKRELRFEEIGLIEFVAIGEYGEGEAMYMYGPRKKLMLSAGATPNYAQIRDRILSSVKCPIRR